MGHSDKFKKVLMRLVEEMAAEGSGSDDDVRQTISSPKRRGRPPKNAGKVEGVAVVEKTVVPVELIKAVKQINQNVHELQPLENDEMKHTGAAHRGIPEKAQMYEVESAIKASGVPLSSHSDEMKMMRAEIDALKSGKKTKAKAEKFVGKAAKVADKEKVKKAKAPRAKAKTEAQLEEAGKLSAVQGEVFRERPGSVLGQTVKPSPHKTIDPLVFSNLAKMGISS
jgi:hypothetical protein